MASACRSSASATRSRVSVPSAGSSGRRSAASPDLRAAATVRSPTRSVDAVCGRLSRAHTSSTTTSRCRAGRRRTSSAVSRTDAGAGSSRRPRSTARHPATTWLRSSATAVPGSARRSCRRTRTRKARWTTDSATSRSPTSSAASRTMVSRWAAYRPSRSVDTAERPRTADLPPRRARPWSRRQVFIVAFGSGQRPGSMTATGPTVPASTAGPRITRVMPAVNRFVGH